ncbi:MAG: SpoIIE family protein phosphatase [Bacillota bacterium]
MANSILNTADLSLNLCAFMLGRATILGSISPFGLALYAAARYAVPRQLPAVTFYVALGMISTGAQPETFLRLSLLLAAAAMLRNARAGKPVAGALAVSGLLLVGRGGLALMIAGLNAYVLTLAGFEAILAAIMTMVFSYGLPVLVSRKPPLYRPSSEEISCSVVMLVSTVAGVGEIAVGPMMLKNVTAAFLTMGLAYLGGSGLGAATGAAAGVMAGVTSGLIPASAGVFAFGGLLGGVFRILGKPGVAVGFFLGATGLLLQLSTPDVLAGTTAEHVLAGMLFLVVPVSVFSSLTQRLGLVTPQERAGGGEEQLVRTALSNRLYEVSQVFRELSRAFEQTAASTPSVEQDRQRIFGNIACRVCEACSSYRLCWEQDFQQTYRGMYDLLTLAELNNGLREEHVPKELRVRCSHLHELVSTINYLLDLARLNLSWQRRVDESREVVSAQLRGVSRVMDGLALEVVSREERVMDPPSRTLHYEAGIAKMAKRGSIVSGDSFVARELADGRLLVILSDGMGAGPRAAMESKATVSLLERLLVTGFDRETAVRTVNSILLLRSSEEIFATVDLVLIDLSTGRTEFVKIGAMPTFIRREDAMSVVKSDTLPIGILSQIHVECVERFLVNGDVLVMATDGLFSGLRQGVNRDNWVCGFLARYRSSNPKEIAEKLVQRGLGQKAEPDDDVTVIVIRLTAADAKTARDVAVAP